MSANALHLAGLNPQPPPRSFSCCSCKLVQSTASASMCLAYCGYAFWPDAYDSSVLSELYADFLSWSSSARPDARRFMSYNDMAGLRGRRSQILLPGADVLSSGVDGVIFNANISAAHSSLLEGLFGGASLRPMLNFASVIGSTPYTTVQDLHADSPAQDGLKVQVPLTEVTDAMGPLEVVLSPDQPGHAECPVVRGTCALGTALMYRHVQPHRGSRPTAGGPLRTALDLSYMVATSVEHDDYLATGVYTQHAESVTAAHRLRAAELCAASSRAGTCASVDAVRSVRGSRNTFAGPPFQFDFAEGWVGRYRGTGTSPAGIWVDANGAIYCGGFVDGHRNGQGTHRLPTGNFYEGRFVKDLMHGHGRYVHTEGEVWEGEFRNNELHGYAEIQFSNSAGGVKGHFSRGTLVNGSYTSPDGTVLTGAFQNAVLNGDCTIQYPDGRSYEGMCANNLPHGRGKGMKNGEIVFHGQWKMGKPFAS